MFCYMKVLSAFLCLLLLHQNASASCSPGQRLNYNTKICEACPLEQYSSIPGTHLACQNCNKCKKGSKEIKACTPTSNTQCKCIKGFTPIDRLKEEFCACEKGSGIDERGICKKCQDGSFTDKRDSFCKKWRECKSGIANQGTSTSDVVCNNASKEVTEPPKAHTTPFQTTTISSTAFSRTTDSSSNNTKKDSFYGLWLVMACAGVILLAGLLYHKCKVTHCIHNHKKVDFRKESVCRKPVEESGEKCLSLLV
ncbi:tumor necrosis factor receptor superfamily member 9 [Sinocyclocheilus anshuiensis]|nr:PREDICTED: tumor necrosis factor receptor superfamily member 9-like [Sinocyclocheilus anshuiensis]